MTFSGSNGNALFVMHQISANNATYGQKNVINVTVAITIPGRLSAHVAIVTARPWARMVQAEPHSRPGKDGEPRISVR